MIPCDACNQPIEVAWLKELVCLILLPFSAPGELSTSYGYRVVDKFGNISYDETLNLCHKCIPKYMNYVKRVTTEKFNRERKQDEINRERKILRYKNIINEIRGTR